MEYELRPAGFQDIQPILGWIHGPEPLRTWGGPLLSFPPDPQAVWSTIQGSPECTFALVDARGRLAGFGQTLPRPPAVHLARIIVAPDLRGQGVGRLLCEKLIHAARTRQRPDEITLRVYASNRPALELYLSLGFQPLPGQGPSETLLMHLRPVPAG